ncbi:MAG: glycosyltransferase family 2 protein [Planctomycetia bacterium]|jgi:dolichol-phosphate mannosyltransferase|nr:glycosyltransferase family 2 protein [Planctomycetia bacterium]MCC7316743.1 glycosyltransferase family 2 protein [Planctomycetota bacterium]OQZ05714.1 MAG: hypothetical protein B6D36_08750 [Planctomycetes bacterium UTPLA1]
MRTLAAIPVFNEARYVARVVSDVKECLSDVLIIDDGSTDDTPRILRDIGNIHLITHPENRGYGQSLIDAFAFAKRGGYDWIITLDCDDQHEPDRIPEFIARAAEDDADIISGSRYLLDFPVSTQAPEDRRRINMRITRFLNEKLGLSLTDAFCGFKAYRVSSVAELPLTVPGYAFPMQFWVQAVRHCLRIVELPVPLIYNDPTRHFGGILDDPNSRLDHYMDVFHAEFNQPAKSRSAVQRCGTTCK